MATARSGYAESSIAASALTSSSPIPTIYDETHRGRWAVEPEIASVGNSANLLGYLPYHDFSTDGSFAICLAGGSSDFVSQVRLLRSRPVRHVALIPILQALYESIPEAHRPALNTRFAGTEVPFRIFGESEEAIGSTIMPIVFTNARTGKKFCIKLYALVLPKLMMGMFIGEGSATYFRMLKREAGMMKWVFDFGNGEEVEVHHRK